MAGHLQIQETGFARRETADCCQREMKRYLFGVLLVIGPLSASLGRLARSRSYSNLLTSQAVISQERHSQIDSFQVSYQFIAQQKA